MKKWSAYAKAKNIAGHKDKPLTNDPMEATYIGINMWAQAVAKAKSTDTDKVIAAMAGQTFTAPGGFVSTMDKENHHPAQAGVHRRSQGRWPVQRGVEDQGPGAGRPLERLHRREQGQEETSPEKK